MTFRDYLQVLRRRLLVLVAGLLIGVVAGWVTAPGHARGETTFRATHTLIYDPAGGQGYNINQVALLATSGEVPSRVAARLKVDRSAVRSAVSAVAETDVSTISITGHSADPAKVVSLADVTAEELAAELGRRDRAAFDTEVGRLTAAVETAQRRLGAVPPKDSSGQTAAQTELEAAQRALKQYQSAGPKKSQLRTLETATATAISPAGVRAPNSKPVRATLLGGLALMAALGGILAHERLDTRIRTKRRAEEAFGAPVVAEVPHVSKSSQGQLLTRTQPTSGFVEAYRGLRTYVALWSPEAGHDDGHRVIVVSSPAAGEGKTTTVAHLAAMLAEIGRSVLVVSADMRRPRLHEYFDRPGVPGLIDVVAPTPDAPKFDDLDLSTSVRGVKLVPSGPAVENPAPVLEHARDLVALVRDMAEFVLIDTPPLLIANDAVELGRYADGILLVGRAGRTPIEAAQSSAELLQRLEIPVVGVVLVGSDSASSASRYYASRYYSAPDRSGWLRRRPGGDRHRPNSGAGAGAEEASPAATHP
jgi:capsular exopolysaccharide synthesis family protein